MQLEEFVRETLIQVLNGVQQAKNGRPGLSGGVNRKPEALSARNNVVKFDVAVTVKDSVEGKGGAGIFVAGIGIGAQGTTGASSEAVSRVEFSVPVDYP